MSASTITQINGDGTTTVWDENGMHKVPTGDDPARQMFIRDLRMHGLKHCWRKGTTTDAPEFWENTERGKKIIGRKHLEDSPQKESLKMY